MFTLWILQQIKNSKGIWYGVMQPNWSCSTRRVVTHPYLSTPVYLMQGFNNLKSWTQVKPMDFPFSCFIMYCLPNSADLLPAIPSPCTISILYIWGSREASSCCSFFKGGPLWLLVLPLRRNTAVSSGTWLLQHRSLYCLLETQSSSKLVAEGYEHIQTGQTCSWAVASVIPVEIIFNVSLRD